MAAMATVKAARDATNRANGVLGALTPRQGDATLEASLDKQTSSYATFAEPGAARGLACGDG